MFNSFFKINDTKTTTIGLHEALGMAKANDLDMAYDPEGKHDATSYFYCLAVLDNLLDAGIIYKYVRLKVKNAPSFPEGKRDVIY